MTTQTKEHYLKSIYFLDTNDEDITVTALGKSMGVSKPTVNSMINKLSAEGLIKYERYKPIKFTKKGRLTAALIVRKHRLTEMFLVQIMGFGWEEVHKIAEEMEHLKTAKLFDRMDEILGFPTVDPHGSPIPNKLGKVDETQLVALSMLLPGTSSVLRAVGDSSVALLNLLNEKKICLGTAFQVHKVEEFDKSMTVSYGAESKVILSYEVCKRLLVDEG